MRAVAIRRITALILIALIFGTQNWIVPPVASAADPCVGVRFIAVRGSGEEGGPEGNTAKAIYDAMKPFSAGTQTALTGIDYAAVAMDPGGIAGTFISAGWRYQSSKSGGVRNLDAYLDQQVSCADERWVLIGFSQGAHVIADALSSGDGTLSAEQQNKLAAVVLLADPRFNPQAPYAAGTYSIARYGVAGKRGANDLTRSDAIRSWCDADDFVCQGVGTDNRNSVHSGTRYVTQYKDAITTFIRSKLGWSGSAGSAGGYTGAIDVAFAIDTTGSMGDDIDRVTAAAGGLFDTLKISGADARVGLVDYKDGDQGDPYIARLDLPFTNDAPAFRTALDSLSASGGGDDPEAVLSGIQTAIDGLAWRNGAKKAIIALGDAPGKDPEPFSGLTRASVLTAAFNLDPAQIYPVVLSTWAESFFAPLAEGSAGTLFPVTDPTTITDVLTETLLTVVSSPIAVLSPLPASRVGKELTLSAAGSYDPKGLPLIKYEWDFEGDGTYDAETTEPFVNHAYSAAFTGSAAVRITNSEDSSASGSTPIEITEDGAIAPDAAPAGVSNLTAAATGSTVSVTWRAPAGLVDGFEVSMTPSSATVPAVVGVGSESNAEFAETPAGSYVVSVAPFNSAGVGPAQTVPVVVGSPQVADQISITFRDDRSGKATIWSGDIGRGDVRISPRGGPELKAVAGTAQLASSPPTGILLAAAKSRSKWSGVFVAKQGSTVISGTVSSATFAGEATAVLTGRAVMAGNGKPLVGRVEIKVFDRVNS